MRRLTAPKINCIYVHLAAAFPAEQHFGFVAVFLVGRTFGFKLFPVFIVLIFPFYSFYFSLLFISFLLWGYLFYFCLLFFVGPSALCDSLWLSPIYKLLLFFVLLVSSYEVIFCLFFAYFYLLLGESSALCDSLTWDVWLSPICKLLESVFIDIVISSVWQLGLNRPSCHPFASSWSWRFIYFYYSFALGHQLCVAVGPEPMSFVVTLLVCLLPICKLLEFRDSDFLL